MTVTKLEANYVALMADYLFRPAIVEARLVNEKHADNPAYVAALASELQEIEQRMSAMERSLQINMGGEDSRPRPCRMPETGPNVRWLRDLSGELINRLHRLEQRAPSRVEGMPPRSRARVV
ncbi:MAG TPA: hypothetical protein VL240_03945 [Candidatus Binatia bacterium]|nr:hypothetical protein [Candidatus Binatia bacterium]